MLTLVEDDNCNVSRRAEDRDISSSTTILGGHRAGSSSEHKHKVTIEILHMIVGLLVPVLVFLDDSNNHHLEQQHVAVASPPSSSIIIAGGIGATSTSLPRLNRLSLSNTVVASTQEEVTPSSEAAYRDAPSYRVWDLPNGSVEFHNPFIFDGLTLRSSSSSVQQILESDQSSSVSETSSIALWDPIFLGR